MAECAFVLLGQSLCAIVGQKQQQKAKKLMERAAMGRLTHKITAKEKDQLASLVGRLKLADMRTKRSVIATEFATEHPADKQAGKATGTENTVVTFPKEFYNFFDVEAS